MQRDTNRIWGAFWRVMLALVLGCGAFAVAAVVWAVLHWESSEELPWSFAVIAFGPAALTLVGVLGSAIQVPAAERRRSLGKALIGGLGLPALIAAGIAAGVWFNDVRNDRAAQERRQLETDFWQFLDEASPGLAGFSAADHRHSADVRLATACTKEDFPIEGRTIHLDDGTKAGAELHRKLVDAGYETSFRRYAGPADSYEILAITGRKDETYARAFIELVPGESVLTFHMAAGSCVDRHGLHLATQPVPGIPVDATFDAPDFARRTGGPIGTGMWTRQTIPDDDGYERRCGRDGVGTGSVSRVWTTADVAKPHIEAVEFIADLHADVVSDGWDTRFAQLRSTSAAGTDELAEQRVLEAYRDDSMLRVSISLTMDGDETAAVLIQHHHGPCIGTLDATPLDTAAGWTTLTDPYTFTPLPAG